MSSKNAKNPAAGGDLRSRQGARRADARLARETVAFTDERFVPRVDGSRRSILPAGARAGRLAGDDSPDGPGRLTRSRWGLAPSYHGSGDHDRGDYLVHTEFGADVWALLAESGLDRMGVWVVAWPREVCRTKQRATV